MANPTSPPWPPCGDGADSTSDRVGCRGVHVRGYDRCLAHLDPDDRAAYLATLSPGTNVDHRGTPFTESLLTALLRPLHDLATNRYLLGIAQFDGATFTGDAWFNNATFTLGRFNEATFTGDAWFSGATFTDDVWFGGATFKQKAQFKGATFTGEAQFGGATFTGDAQFGGGTFPGDALFGGATFTGDAQFDGATFKCAPSFCGATFEQGAWFYGATFAVSSSLGPLTASGRTISLNNAVFEAPVTIEIAAAKVVCKRTRWESTATLRFRYASVDLSDAVLSSPVAIVAHPAPFAEACGDALDEQSLASTACGVRVTSLRGVDAAHLVLTDVDLSECQFSGAFHLDRLRLEGNCKFAYPPERPRWTRRRVLAEEHHWRALMPGNPAAPRGWTPGPHHPDVAVTPGPDELASVYRALRKATEDAKNEPDAADFYYGEMAMRRHDRARPCGERTLLTVYWALSGYGLRALRALG